MVYCDVLHTILTKQHQNGISISSQVEDLMSKLEMKGNTVIIIAIDNNIVAILALQDEIKHGMALYGMLWYGIFCNFWMLALLIWSNC